ncbi:MAG: hypothetical protein HYR56_30955 [Acidobacteria bacterium]|nr:hypothetical protein [Acidobacteriota bacterium]MBI3426001.1 hypothetical protein [Acidobacteriota bacterium]
MITSNHSPSASRKRARWLVLAVLLAALGWAAYNLYAPRQTKLREFDANEVARIETAMWRSYYDKERLALFTQLAELMRSQYRMTLLRSNEAAYQAAKAAFVFKEGKQRTDYEKALPSIRNFYRDIRAQSDTPFDVERAAKLELEWWIIHRQRAQHKDGDLARSLAELQAELFQLPVERFTEHARLRAEAMTIRDDKAEAGSVTEADWQHIDELLHRSWQSLWKAVQPG